MDCQLRELVTEELPLTTRIDRSDYSAETYKVIEGKLVRQPLTFHHPGIGKEDYQPYINDLQACLEKGGKVFGAFAEGELVGIGSIDNDPVGKYRNMLNLGILWVSKDVRRKGIAGKLFAVCREEVLRRHYTRMYVSATPSRNTVDFYLKMGCVLSEEVDLGLFTKEPEDIHLELLCE